MESHLLDILVCPLCKGPLHYDRPAQTLICRADKLAFPVRDGIPVMLESEATPLAPDDTAPSGTATETPTPTPTPTTDHPESQA